MLNEPEDEGWGSPINAKKAHYFVGGHALCNGWMFFGKPDKNQAMGEQPGQDDCKVCWKRAAARKSKSGG